MDFVPDMCDLTQITVSPWDKNASYIFTKRMQNLTQIAISPYP